MNRTEYMKSVYDSQLDSASKTIMVYYAFRKHWKENGLVWVSSDTVAEATGLSQRTVKERIPRLRDAGWLVDTGLRVPNGKGRPSIKYDLGAGAALKVENISATVAPKVQNISAAVAPKVVDLGATDEGLRCKNEGTLVQNLHDFSATVAQEQVREQVKNKKEEQETTTTVPDGPVVQDPLEVRTDDQPLPNSRTPQPSLTTRRRLTVGEMREFDRTMTNHGVSEEMAVESLELLQRSNGTTPFREALEEALQSLGVLSERSADW